MRSWIAVRHVPIQQTRSSTERALAENELTTDIAITMRQEEREYD